jgi:hypothetical protein
MSRAQRPPGQRAPRMPAPPLVSPPRPESGAAWRVSELRAHGYEYTRAADLPLVRAAGGEVVRLSGDRAPGKLYMAAGLVLRAVHVARQVAHRTGANPRTVLVALNRARLVAPVGKFAETGHFNEGEINGALAGILGMPVVTGPIRAWPSGKFEIQRKGGEWIEATDELLGALDAESRLDGALSIEHHAAATIRRWQGKEGADE